LGWPRLPILLLHQPENGKRVLKRDGTRASRG